MSAVLVDTHCHPESDSFRQDFEEVLVRAARAGVAQLLAIGISAATSQAVVVLANRHPGISAVVGVHPNHTHEIRPGDWEKIEELAFHPRVVGIGETGLDNYWKDVPLDLQHDSFCRHIQLSRRCGKPFVVHCREAEAEVLAVLREAAEAGPLQGVMHSFCGSDAVADECLQLGMYISFSGMLTYRRNDVLRATAARIPPEKLLIETDAPYLAPQQYRGKRNEPAWVADTCACLADIHGMSLSQMAALTTANARRLFRLGDESLMLPPTE
ncbi:MAG TPA: hydrolase TatD [Planctomycetaceae bacterium]|nr:hydrolase TatD [Planctomycetaceae bacterium]